MFKRLLWIGAPVLAAGMCTLPATTAAAAPAACAPSSVLDLANWKLTLPTGVTVTHS
ncbi:hypothetical protein OG738_38185 [Amycolatopsis sp. NBC_01488]|uniref:hypothetical protein n=1 Tax=Amycolatopsis sp. NBC_01488 TaxID=2903563 RepID=UPI002E2B9DBE|nr:hypothetical protein [Amycolatopsis sp. NBC_01488]